MNEERLAERYGSYGISINPNETKTNQLCLSPRKLLTRNFEPSGFS